MDNRQGKRKLYKNNLISEIPYQERRKVCMLLDVKDDWKKIVGLIKSYSGDGPRYDDIHVLMFEKEKSHRYGSPTDCLLNDWRSIRPKIGDLMEVLICANLRSVANYVSEEVLQEGKVNMPIQQADDGGSFASLLPSYEEDLNARGPNDFEPPSSMGYREHSLDPSMIASISGFATRHNIPVYSYEDLEQHTDMFNAEPLDIGGRLLGSGGYGKVFMGINKASQDRDVFAVKRFNDESLSHLKTLQSEMASIFMNFKHPNLLPIRGVCYESHFCVLYEYMVEGTLDDHLSKKKESMSRAVLNSLQRISVAIDVARGVEHLHRIKPNPIVHRDIKPANILLGNDYQAKLGDFGLIRVQKLENNGHTNTTVDVHGTTMYMPPEAMTGKVSTKWDIYSFGVVLLELLFAKGPGYTEEDGHTIKLIEAVFDDDIFEDLPMHMLDSDCDWNMEIARQLVEFVEKCGLKRQKRPEISGSDNAVLETLLKLQATANRISR